MKLIIPLFFLVLGLRHTCAQEQTDLLIHRSGDSIACRIMDFNADWVTVTLNKNGKVRKRNFASTKVRSLIRNHGREGQRIVYGEGYEPFPLANQDRTNEAAADTALASMQAALVQSANHLTDAGTWGLTGIGITVISTIVGAAVIGAGAPLTMGLTIITFGAGLAITSDIISNGHLLKAARGLRRAAGR